MYMGFSQDIEAARIFAIYQDPNDSCDVVVMVYPGQTVEFYKGTANSVCQIVEHGSRICFVTENLGVFHVNGLKYAFPYS